VDKYIGKRLDGRYHIEELIGVGGMANVYKAHDILDGKVVAVKLLRDEYNDNEEFIRRFKMESKAISLLSHPNIVKVYDICFGDRFKCIVMEYVDGITLKEYIEQQGVIKWKEVIHFVVQILKALQHAHDRGIVHRDIKPQNIMLLSDGTIKITDFGIARFARSETRTLSDRAIGSVHYISPEQAQAGKTDEKTDIYSVGVMMFEMLTGKLPFEADSPVSVALKQIQTQPIMPRSINPAIPEGLEEITMRAMQKDVAKRYQSAAEMLKDIDTFKNNPTISFEYKYMYSISPQDREIYHQQKQQRVKAKETAVLTKNRTSSEKTARPAAAQAALEEDDGRSPYIPVLTGVTVGIMLVAIAFISILLYINRPFEKMPDITVPNLVGANYETIRKTQMYAGNFDIRATTEFNDEYASGIVFEQKPAAGRNVKPGTIINVKVSSGQRIVVLPDFKSQESTIVFAKIADLGLKYEERAIYDDFVPAGSIVSTSPEANTEVASGTTIVVYVSQGPQEMTIDVPSVKGMNIADAKAALANAKLQVGNVKQEVSDRPVGEVLSQSPAPPSKVAENSAVDLVISSGSNEVKSVTILVRLPQSITKPVEVYATVDGGEPQGETVVPSEIRVWKPRFEGTGKSIVKIFVDNKLYQVYPVDFDIPAVSPPIEDYSDKFK